MARKIYVKAVTMSECLIASSLFHISHIINDCITEIFGFKNARPIPGGAVLRLYGSFPLRISDQRRDNGPDNP